MDINNMRYFVAVAGCLNFSKAAEQMYITQPALSRIISSIEKELEVQLFIRDSRSIRLTPAGKVLLEEFGSIYEQYNFAVKKAVSVQKGLSGQLNIGILDGEIVGDLFPEALLFFAQNYPDLEINLEKYSFSGLTERLYDGRLDLAITLYFDIKHRMKLEKRIIDKTKDHMVVLKSHPLANRKIASLKDFADDLFIMVDPHDSYESSRLILDVCTEQGFTPKMKYVPSVESVMLMVEAGVGVTILDTRNALISNPNMSFVEIDSCFEPYLTLAWHQDNKNPSRELFTSIFLKEPVKTT